MQCPTLARQHPMPVSGAVPGGRARAQVEAAPTWRRPQSGPLFSSARRGRRTVEDEVDVEADLSSFHAAP